MQYIVLIGDENLTLDSIKSINHYGSINSYDVTEIEGRFCVDYGSDHIFYDYEGDSLDGFEDSDLENIPFKKPCFIMMTYTSKERMKTVIQQSNFLKGIYVDNDFGLLVPIEDFIKMEMPMD